MIRFYSSEEKTITGVLIDLPYTGTPYTSVTLYVNDDEYTATWTWDVYGGIYVASGVIHITRNAAGEEISQTQQAQGMGAITAQQGINTVWSSAGEVTISGVDVLSNSESFTLDGVSSSFYGVGLSGTGVYDAPARKGESISVPGRNGNIWVDDGSFENVLVTYPCWMSADFDEKVDDFRAYLSRHSDAYYKLTDTYHPGEYRMGRYAGPFMTTPGTRNKSGRMDVAFDCMPQRFLNSGNEWTELNIGGSTEITNPTLFPAYPVICFQFGTTVTPTGGTLYISFYDLAAEETSSITISWAGGSVGYLDTADMSVRIDRTSPVDSPDWESFAITNPRVKTLGGAGELVLGGGKTIRINDGSGGSLALTHLSILPRWWTI